MLFRACRDNECLCGQGRERSRDTEAFSEVSAVRQETTGNDSCGQGRLLRCIAVQPASFGAYHHYHQLPESTQGTDSPHGVAHHLLYIAGCDKCLYRFFYRFQGRPLVQYLGHRRARCNGFQYSHPWQQHNRWKGQYDQCTGPLARLPFSCIEWRCCFQ